MAQEKKWQERYFGKTLLDCKTLTKTKKPQTLLTVDVLQKAEIVGVHFTYGNEEDDDFIKKLEDFYELINGSEISGNSVKKFEVVQVVLGTSTKFEDAECGIEEYYTTSYQQSIHRDSLLNLPWFAIPYNDRELELRLKSKYIVESGESTLLLLDKDGGTICAVAKERLLEDPAGAFFPWRSRPVEQILKDVVLQPGGLYMKEHQTSLDVVTYADIPAGIKGFYFSKKCVSVSLTFS
ncbi:nucleoredoxin [Holotrichia oblita]|uniref:Nucleoredoxin n=1 Tax=Holotrichia oblita TaxID=644536 RepID=A0ACB9SI71_HOLOL|nr:nucleoredoxin [Holotrichia oblita]